MDRERAEVGQERRDMGDRLAMFGEELARLNGVLALREQENNQLRRES